MPKYSDNKNINRIIDANINRTKEGLRVCEEICRFILNSAVFTAEFKTIRHKIDAILKSLPSRSTLLEARLSNKDIGKNIYINELKRRDYKDILLANLQRIKESVRVLEEFGKLLNTNAAVEFKKIRYRVYETEKRVVKRISSR